MTLRERSKLGAAENARRAAARAETLRQLIEQGEAFKRAAYKVGVSIRAARRYRKSWQ